MSVVMMSGVLAVTEVKLAVAVGRGVPDGAQIIYAVIAIGGIYLICAVAVAAMAERFLSGWLDEHEEMRSAHRWGLFFYGLFWPLLPVVFFGMVIFCGNGRARDDRA